MAVSDDEFLKRTVETWQPLSEVPLTLDDAREIIENAVGFYGTLIRWAKEARRDEENGKPARYPCTRTF